MIEKKKQLVKLGKALACIGIERESARRDLETLTKQGHLIHRRKCCKPCSVFRQPRKGGRRRKRNISHYGVRL